MHNYIYYQCSTRVLKHRILSPTKRSNEGHELMGSPAATLGAITQLAKLTPPRLSDVYARTALYAELDRALERPIVWVSGAPGAGKTTAVSAYLEARKQRVLWYQLDGGDSDPATFFHYLSIAAQALAPRSHNSLPSLTPEHLPSLGAFARRYFNAWARCARKRPPWCWIIITRWPLTRRYMPCWPQRCRCYRRSFALS